MLMAEKTIHNARLQSENKSTSELAKFVVACQHILHLETSKKNNYSANSEAEIRLTRNFTRIDLNTDEFSDFEPFNPKNKKRLEKFEMTYSRGDIYAYVTDSSSEASSWKIGILLSIPSYINKTHCIFAVQPLQCVFF